MAKIKAVNCIFSQFFASVSLKRRLDLETHETKRDREKELESEQANKRKKKGERKRAGGFILHKSQVELPSKATSRRSRVSGT